jgi:structural maintenance of chromosome 3 (chondroitin sulfate proteoglycan 6)
MVSKLNFDEKFEKAFMYIFGRTLICRNLEVATNLARSTHLDCVTLDGDQVGYRRRYIRFLTSLHFLWPFILPEVFSDLVQVSSKGSLTGGYFNKSRSRLEIQKSRSDLMVSVKEAEENLSGLKTKLSEVEGHINQVVGDMQKMETKNSKAKCVVVATFFFLS